MNYADAVASDDKLAILTAKKRIFSQSDPENEYHLIYQLSSTSPFNVQDAVSELLTSFATVHLPNAGKPIKSLAAHLDNIDVDVSHLEDAGNADVPLLRLAFPHPWNRHTESINLILLNAANSVNISLTRVFPRIPMSVVRVNTTDIDEASRLLVNNGILLDLQQNTQNQIYALIAGDVTPSGFVEIIN